MSIPKERQSIEFGSVYEKLGHRNIKKEKSIENFLGVSKINYLQF